MTGTSGISGALADLARWVPDRPAVSVWRSSILTYGELWSWAGQVAALGAGLPRQVGLCFAHREWPSWAAALIGVLMVGREPVLLPGDATDEELEELVARLSLGVVIHGSARSAPGRARGAVWLAMPENRATRRPICESAAPESLVLLTSGSTSAPKAVRLGPPLLPEGQASTRLKLRGQLLHHFPPWSVAGAMAIFARHVARGVGTVVMPVFDPARFLTVMGDREIAACSVTPAAAEALVHTLRRHPQDRVTRGPRIIWISGAACPRSLAADLERSFPGSIVRDLYSLTEAAGQPAALGVARGHGPSVGHMRTVVRDASGRDVRGEPGEVWVQASVPATELSSPGGRPADGWVRTGDLAIVDPDGSLRFLGRNTNVANVGGRKVSLAEVESALLEHPGVGDACVVATGRDTPAEALGAAVVLVSPVEANALRRHMASRLASWKVPRRYVAVEAIPRGALGKPLMSEIEKLMAVARALPP